MQEDAAERELLQDAGHDGEEQQQLPKGHLVAQQSVAEGLEHVLGHGEDVAVHKLGKADPDEVAGGGPDDYGQPDQRVYRPQREGGARVEPVPPDHQERSAEEDEHQIDHDLPAHAEVLAEPEGDDQEGHPHHAEPAEYVSREERGPAHEVCLVEVGV